MSIQEDIQQKLSETRTNYMNQLYRETGQIPDVINEEMHLEEDWFSEARTQTSKTLPAFMRKVMNGYFHDYGSVVHAIASCVIAAFYAANRSTGAQGGITGFQASCVMWDFLKQLFYSDNECGLQIINYDDMLYPQMGFKFEKIIDDDTLDRIRSEAKRKLENADASDICIDHWKSIVEGKVPFGYTVKKEMRKNK